MVQTHDHTKVLKFPVDCIHFRPWESCLPFPTGGSHGDNGADMVCNLHVPCIKSDGRLTNAQDTHAS